MVNDLTKLSFSEKISTSKYLLMQNLPFIGAVAYQVPVIEMTDEDMNGTIAYTDGLRICMNGEYFASRPVPEVLSILAHEIGHIVLKSVTRRGVRLPFLWNIATDFVINGTLDASTKGAKYFAWPTTNIKGDKIKLCLDHKYDGMTAETVYDLIMQEANKQQQKGMPNSGKGDSTSDGGLSVPYKSFDPKTGAMNPRTANGEEKTAPEVEDITSEIISKAAITAQEFIRNNNCGSGAGCMLEMVDAMLSNKVDWRKILHRSLRTFGFDKPDYSRPSRRTMVNIYTGVSKFYYPRMRGSKPGNIFMCIDSSGSVSSESLKEFLGEINNCLRGMPGCKVYLYTCDAELYKLGTFQNKLPTQVEIHGRGGTSFEPAFKEALKVAKHDKQLATFVYFTDGICTYPNYKNGELPFKVFWCFDNNAVENAPFGKTIRITD